MDYFDEEILEAKRELERQKHTTLETGMYAGEELITFSQQVLPNSVIRLPIPEQFVIMTKEVKRIKYPSLDAPDLILTSLSSTVNLTFNQLPIQLQEGEIKEMSIQFQNVLRNINAAIIIKNLKDTKTLQGNEMSWFEYKGYHIDGQSYNRVHLIRLEKTILHGTFSCKLKDWIHWGQIVDKIFLAVEENL